MHHLLYLLIQYDLSKSHLVPISAACSDSARDRKTYCRLHSLTQDTVICTLPGTIRVQQAETLQQEAQLDPCLRKQLGSAASTPQLSHSTAGSRGGGDGTLLVVCGVKVCRALLLIHPHTHKAPTPSPIQITKHSCITNLYSVCVCVHT